MKVKMFSEKTLIRKLIRLPLRLIPPKTQLPILLGRIQGKKWIVGSGLHSFWIGNFESKKQKLFAKYVTAESVVFDIGANVGFYTLLASELVGPKGLVVSFEPVTRNIKFLRDHISINNLINVVVIEAAVSDIDGSSFFDQGPNRLMGKLNSKGDLQVRTITLDQLIAEKEIPFPDFMKIDIEGAEMLALKGASQVLNVKHPIIFLATHGHDVHKDCCEFLNNYGYKIQPIDGNELEFSKEVIAFFNA